MASATKQEEDRRYLQQALYSASVVTVSGAAFFRRMSGCILIIRHVDLLRLTVRILEVTEKDVLQEPTVETCGSNAGSSPAYVDAARALARVFHERKVTLVYGAGTSGIMGELAKTLVSLSGPSAVHGFVPWALVRATDTSENDSGNGSHTPGVGKKTEASISEIDLKGLDRTATTTLPHLTEFGITTIVPDMHTRKRLMAIEVLKGGPGSGFMALPGGFGTLEEVMEIVTWNQLGIHDRGVVLLNVEGYWDALLQWIRHAALEAFIGGGNENILASCDNVVDAIECLRNYKPSEGRLKLNWNLG
ncbi:hypothetical protein V1525DRAFT_387381 [Lipomyces kononenkoae]|uniref:Uncharacterized protein n=1 Tax=Lipomyces kononenkoae TaxID=34357 RepID=A0ACC3T3X5_LIPKO